MEWQELPFEGGFFVIASRGRRIRAKTQSKVSVFVTISPSFFHHRALFTGYAIKSSLALWVFPF